ncbi:unnamed protein product, partial [Ectocarpus fasciculatus]
PIPSCVQWKCPRRGHGSSGRGLGVAECVQPISAGRNIPVEPQPSRRGASGGHKDGVCPGSDGCWKGGSHAGVYFGGVRSPHPTTWSNRND